MNSNLRRKKPSYQKSKLKKRNKKAPLNALLSDVKYVDYKNVELLNKFINIHCKIMPGRSNRLTASQQRQVRLAIVRARHMALIPYTCERRINVKHS